MSTDELEITRPRPWAVVALVASSTVLGIIGTDLILPAIPALPGDLGGSTAQAQYVLAAFVSGACIGLLVFGALGDRFSTSSLFAGSLLLTAVLSLACAAATRVEALIGLRCLQGAAAAGPAVFAPGIIRSLYRGSSAVRVLGLLGSLEALAPALAPIMGVWLLMLGGWRLSFVVMGVLAALLGFLLLSVPMIPQTSRRPSGRYAVLLSDPVFLRYALSQALALGGLLTFVFGMPAAFTHSLPESMSGFVAMQVCGVATFILAANISGKAAERFGVEKAIVGGTAVCCTGALGLLLYAAAGGSDLPVFVALWVVVNLGFGLRGPPGFFQAVIASRNDDARGSALVVLGFLGFGAIGTVIAAPFLELGIAPLAATSFVLQALGLSCLLLLPRQKPRKEL